MKKDKNHKCSIIEDLVCDICGGSLCHECSSFHNVMELPFGASSEVLIFRICNKCMCTPMNALKEKDKELMMNLFHYESIRRDKDRRIDEITAVMDRELNKVFSKIKERSGGS